MNELFMKGTVVFLSFILSLLGLGDDEPEDQRAHTSQEEIQRKMEDVLPRSEIIEGQSQEDRGYLSVLDRFEQAGDGKHVQEINGPRKQIDAEASEAKAKAKAEAEAEAVAEVETGTGDEAESKTDSRGIDNVEDTSRSRGARNQEGTRSGKKPEGTDFRVMFAGDSHFMWAINEMQQEEGITSPVESIANEMRKSDFSVLNLETVIAREGDPLFKKVYIFRAPPERIEALSYLGIDLVTLGNNHTMDLGEAGMHETISHLRNSGIGSVGAGSDRKRALSPYYLKAGELKIAFIGVSEIGPPKSFASSRRPGVADLKHALRSIRKAASVADQVIVNVHWGREYISTPEALHRRLAHRMIDAGATLIIGHHPHIPRGVEKYKEGLIFYSLGNFLFGSKTSFQTDNILVETIFNTETQSLRGARIIPVNGRYRRSGHRIKKLSLDESRQMWEEILVETAALNGGLPGWIKVDSSGIGYIKIELESP